MSRTSGADLEPPRFRQRDDLGEETGLTDPHLPLDDGRLRHALGGAISQCAERLRLGGATDEPRPWGGLIEQAKAAVDPIMSGFRRVATDHSSFGPGKAIASAMMADGIDMSDQAAVDRWITNFQQSPLPRARRASRVPSPFDPK